jgi:hypothetical protein
VHLQFFSAPVAGHLRLHLIFTSPVGIDVYNFLDTPISISSIIKLQDNLSIKPTGITVAECVVVSGPSGSGKSHYIEQRVCNSMPSKFSVLSCNESFSVLPFIKIYLDWQANLEEDEHDAPTIAIHLST